jgi:hypothetical protein
MSSTKFVTFVSPLAGSDFAPDGRAIYYPSHEAIAFFVCSPVAELCASSICTGSRRESACDRSCSDFYSESGQTADEELVDPHHSSAADIR